MMSKLYTLFLLIFLFGYSHAQNDAFTSPRISNKMTLNPDQNKKWKKGLYKYAAKPKSAWELGIHGGHFFIDGDVDRRIPSGFGVGLHLRKAIHYVFSVRLDLFYGQAFGIDAQVWKHKSMGGGLVESVFNDYENLEGWYPKVKTHYSYASFQTIINIGNILFHKERNKWNWYMVIGAGLDTHQAMLDLYNRSGDPYDITSIKMLGLDHNNRKERIQLKNAIDNLYDGKYETVGPKKEGIFRVADKFNIHALFTGAMGISRKLNKRVNIALEHQVMSSDNDYLDGIKYRSATDQTNNLDISHYTSVRLGINIGNFKKITEPLYWLNPLDGAFNDIAELKQRPVLDLTDSDGDGVIDMMDMEPKSPIGAQVDTRGITLDSDSDGIPDFEDKEPFSPPGFKTDATGSIPKDSWMSKEKVSNMIAAAGEKGGILYKANMDWFLPMIHFDLNKYSIKPEFYGQLKHVADMMKKYPDLCIAAYGHTDIRNSNAYNELLSYNRSNEAIEHLVNQYGIPRDRFKLMYGGEEMPMVPGLPDNHNASKELEMKQYMNRRVEFRTCQDTDFNMPNPEGSSAGQQSDDSSKSGSKKKGTKKSGY